MFRLVPYLWLFNCISRFLTGKWTFTGFLSSAHTAYDTKFKSDRWRQESLWKCKDKQETPGREVPVGLVQSIRVSGALCVREPWRVASGWQFPQPFPHKAWLLYELGTLQLTRKGSPCASWSWAMLLTDALWHPLPAVSHLLPTKGTWCVQAGAQLRAKATRWLLKALQPQILLLANLVIRQEIHSYPILSCWTQNSKTLSFCQRSPSIPSSISYLENLSLWFPAQIMFLISASWLIEGNSINISSKIMGQRTRETNTYSKWASKQGWVDQVDTGRFRISLSSWTAQVQREKAESWSISREKERDGQPKGNSCLWVAKADWQPRGR